MQIAGSFVYPKSVVQLVRQDSLLSMYPWSKLHEKHLFILEEPLQVKHPTWHFTPTKITYLIANTAFNLELVVVITNLILVVSLCVKVPLNWAYSSFLPVSLQ